MNMPSQKEMILRRLQRGPATNRALNEIAFRYSARIEELRAEGHQIEWEPQRHPLTGKPTGLNMYRLVTR